MSHYPKPWSRDRGGKVRWYVSLAGRQVPLGTDKEAAFAEYHRLMQQKSVRTALPVAADNITFAALAKEYLIDLKARRAVRTYEGQTWRLKKAVKVVGQSLLCKDFKRYHMAAMEREFAKFSPTTLKDILAAVQNVFNWAVQNERLPYSPVAGYRKPSPRSRTRVMTDDEFWELLRHADQAFRIVLISMRETGCRPGEIRGLTWSMVDLNQGLWIIPKHKTTTTQRVPLPRIVPLTDLALSICRTLLNRRATANHVFVNNVGGAYTKDCFVRKMDRIRKRAGIEKRAGENVVCYSMRHTMATATVGKVSDFELASLLGHTTTRMIARYAHIDPDRLKDIRRRASS